MSLTHDQVLQRIRTIGLLPVVRAQSAAEGFALANAIVAGGIRALEITMTVPGAVELIGQLRKEHTDVVVGAGTVMDAEAARQCILNGAEFIVSPSLDVATVKLCRGFSVPVFPGALTPTEIVAALGTGARVVKIFPASAMGGASYLKILRGPFPELQMIPTGGVSLSNASSFLEAGAFALGIGADLADREAVAARQFDRISAKAAEFVEIVRTFQQGAEQRV